MYKYNCERNIHSGTYFLLMAVNLVPLWSKYLSERPSPVPPELPKQETKVANTQIKKECSTPFCVQDVEDASEGLCCSPTVTCTVARFNPRLPVCL